MDTSQYQKTNRTVDGYQEYQKGRWTYLLLPCANCGCDTFKRKDVYKKQKLCRSCASKECLSSTDLRDKLRQANTTHGDSSSLTWKSWFRMRRRVRQGADHHPTYEGMYIDPRWEDYQLFLADMGERPSAQHSIDRIDNTQGYFKDNCRWATTKQQCRNRSSNRLLTYQGKTMCLVDWANSLGLTRQCLESRLKRGWSLDKALSTSKQN